MKADKQFQRIHSVVIVLVLSIGLLIHPLPVQAGGLPTTLFVDTTTDSNALAYQVCDADLGNGNCSLRGALTLANSDATPDKVITILVQDGTYTLTGAAGEDGNASGDLDVAPGLASVTIVIRGASQAHTIIDANQLDRVVDFRGPGQLTLSTLTLRNGRVPTGAGLSAGGGAGVRNTQLGTILWLAKVTVDSNTVEGSNGSTDIGGGILNTVGTLNITQSTISHNSAVSGGGIEVSDTTFWLDNSIISNNTASSFGAGLDLGTGSSYTIQKSQILDNDGFNGGGLYCGSATTMNMTNTTVSGNSSASGGGGMMVFCDLSFSFGAIISNTTPTMTAGGGLYIGRTSSVNLSNATIADNTSYWGSGMFLENESFVVIDHVTDANNNLHEDGKGSAVYVNDNGIEGYASFTFYNSIFSAYDPTLTCSITPGGFVTAVSGGYNLYDQTGNCLASALLTDLDFSYPALGSLVYLGGYTPVLPIYASSDAIDSANGYDAPGKDQRSHSRKDGPDGDAIAQPDIGAFEYESDILWIPLIHN